MAFSQSQGDHLKQLVADLRCVQAHRFSCIYELREIRNHNLFCPQSLFNVCGVDNGICSVLNIKTVEIILFLK